MRARLPIVVLCGVLIAPLPLASQSAPEWSQWRGPNRDGISQRDRAAQGPGPQNGPPLAWKATGAGDGYSSFSASAGTALHPRRPRQHGIRDRARSATGKESVGVRRTVAVSRNDQGDGPRSTPTIDGDRLYVLGGSGDLTCLEAANGTEDLVAQPRPALRRRESVLGLQRISADRRRSHPGERGRQARVDRRGEQGGRQAALAAAQRRSRLFVADAAAHRQPVAGRLLHRPAACWPSIRAMDACCGRTPRPRTAPPTSRRRSFAAPACSVSSDYGTGAALLDVKAAGNIASANEVYFTRDMRNHHASSVLVGEHIYGFSSSILTALRVRYGPARLARSQRRQGLADLRG